MVTKKITLSGRVQGVGMRFHVRRTATLYGLKGNVKNIYTGQVQIIVQGEAKIIDSFLLALKKTHPGHIETIDITDFTTSNLYDSFQIKLF